VNYETGDITPMDFLVAGAMAASDVFNIVNWSIRARLIESVVSCASDIVAQRLQGLRKERHYPICGRNIVQHTSNSIHFS